MLVLNRAAVFIYNIIYLIEFGGKNYLKVLVNVHFIVSSLITETLKVVDCGGGGRAEKEVLLEQHQPLLPEHLKSEGNWCLVRIS